MDLVQRGYHLAIGLVTPVIFGVRITHDVVLKGRIVGKESAA